MRRFLLLSLLACTGFLYERAAERRFRARFRPPGRVVEINGHALHLLCMGERWPGRPTVIFEAGHGAWSSAWQKVMPEIAKITRVCAADRAGYGWSADAPAPRLPERMVADLHALLEACGERGPYLFVGHSMGAALGRLFASRYPEEVLGMVWVDSAHEEMLSYMPVGRWAFTLMTAGCWLGALLARVGLLRVTGLGRVIARYPAVSDLRDYAALLEQVTAPLYLETLAHETRTLTDPSGWAGTRPHFGSLPVTMLEAQYPNLLPMPLLTPFWRKFRQGWGRLQDNLAQRSNNIRRIQVPCGHNVQNESPELIVEEVRGMIRRLEN